jgi:addiction module HigA family antidote
MILTVLELSNARSNWIASGGKATDFDLAASVLNAAMSQADVLLGLASPQYSVKLDLLRRWKINAPLSLMMIYTILEYPTYADVTICP